MMYLLIQAKRFFFFYYIYYIRNKFIKSSILIIIKSLIIYSAFIGTDTFHSLLQAYSFVFF